MDYRYLGNSGLKISEITYGNWLTHGSQVENDVATQCVAAALDAGISTFDTADVYANTKAETGLGEALKGERRESLEIFTKVYWPTGPGGKNDSGLSRKHIMESINGSLQRLQTDYVDLYQAHRYDSETPLEETMQAFADVVRQGKALYIGVSEWTAVQIREGVNLSKELGFQLVSSQPQYSMLWRVIEGEVVPTCEELGVSQIVWSPIAQGVLTGKYQPGQHPPEGSRATDDKGAALVVCGSRAFRRVLAGLVLAGEHTLRDGAPDDLADAKFLAGRDDLAFDDPPQHGVLRLARDELEAEFLGKVDSLADLHRGPLADADVERLTLPDDVGERLHRLLERGLAVIAVRLIEVDIVGLESLQ